MNPHVCVLRHQAHQRVNTSNATIVGNLYEVPVNGTIGALIVAGSRFKMQWVKCDDVYRCQHIFWFNGIDFQPVSSVNLLVVVLVFVFLLFSLLVLCVVRPTPSRFVRNHPLL